MQCSLRRFAVVKSRMWHTKLLQVRNHIVNAETTMSGSYVAHLHRKAGMTKAWIALLCKIHIKAYSYLVFSSPNKLSDSDCIMSIKRKR